MRPRRASAIGAGVVLAGAIAVACGGHAGGAAGSGTASVQGTIAGASIPTNNAVGVNGTTTINGPAQTVAGAYLANVGTVCSVLQSGGVPASSSVLFVSVVGASAIAPGTYMLNSATGIGGAVFFTVQDQNCNPTQQSTATQGSVTLSKVSTATVDGTFDVTFPTGDHVTGSFSAPVCTFGPPADAAAANCVQ